MSIHAKSYCAVLVAAVVAATSVASFGAAFTAGDIAVVHAHDGTKLNSSPTAVTIEEYTTAGVHVQTITLPTTAASSGNRACVIGGSASSEGALSLSTDGSFLTVGGYNVTASHSGTAPSTLSASAANRVVAKINANGTFDTTTALTDVFNDNNFRAVSSDGTFFYLAGNSSGDKTSEGVHRATLGATTSTQFTNGDFNIDSPGNLYRIQLNGSNIIVSHRKLDSDYEVNGLASFADSVSTPYAIQLSDWFINNQTSPNVLDNIADFRLANTGNTSAPKVIYMASDDTTTDGNPAGILKFVSNSSGVFSSIPTQVFTSAAFTHGFNGLTVKINPTTHAATLYLTTSDGNNIASFTDSNSSSNTGTGSFNLIVSPGSTKDSYRGIDFVPQS